MSGSRSRARPATVGITDYAQSSLGDIVFVELPKVGDVLEAGKIFGSVESVKAVSDLYSPVSGTVTAINEELKDAPEKINADANATWMHEARAERCERDWIRCCRRHDYEKFVQRRDGTLISVLRVSVQPKSPAGTAKIDALSAEIRC